MVFGLVRRGTLRNLAKLVLDLLVFDYVELGVTMDQLGLVARMHRQWAGRGLPLKYLTSLSSVLLQEPAR
jgi:hypothetical protein